MTMIEQTEHAALADFLRGQAASGDFGHDRVRFARAAELLDLAGAAPVAPVPAAELLDLAGAAPVAPVPAADTTKVLKTQSVGKSTDPLVIIDAATG
jgi:hypothetical protein